MHVLTIIRHLPHSEPVCSKVVKVPDDIDDEEHWQNSVCKEYARQFSDQFPEFKLATFYSRINIVE